MAMEMFLQVTGLLHLYSTEQIVLKTLAVVINIYSSRLHQNGELTFDISLETTYDNISLKPSKYLDTRSLN